MAFWDEETSSRISSVLHARAITIGLLVCLGIGIFLWWFFSSQEPTNSFTMELNESEQTSDAHARTEQGDDAPTETNLVAIHVAGAVRSPGLYELSESSRINDAVAAAGGFTDDADVNSVNLAQKIQDGEQIYVASLTADTSSPSGDSSTNVRAQPSKININRATIDELSTLNGIGEATAKKIVTYRSEHGNFASVEEIMNVSGIGEKKFESIKDDICV